MNNEIKIIPDKLSDKELKAYEDGYLHGLEKSIEIIRHNKDKYGDLAVNSAWSVVHKEIMNSILATIERIKNRSKFEDPTSSVM